MVRVGTFFEANRNPRRLFTASSSCLDGGPAGLQSHDATRLDTLRPLPATNRLGTTAVLRRPLQLNDGEMLAPGHVSDAQAEALAASAPDGSGRSGARRVRQPLVSWLNTRIID